MPVLRFMKGGGGAFSLIEISYVIVGKNLSAKFKREGDTSTVLSPKKRSYYYYYYFSDERKWC